MRRFVLWALLEAIYNVILKHVVKFDPDSTVSSNPTWLEIYVKTFRRNLLPKFPIQKI